MEWVAGKPRALITASRASLLALFFNLEGAYVQPVKANG
jgi:hypothetical protein